VQVTEILNVRPGGTWSNYWILQEYKYWAKTLFASLGSVKHIVLCAGTGVAVKQLYNYYILKQSILWNFKHFRLPFQNFTSYLAVQKNIFKRLNKTTRNYPHLKFHVETINKLTHKPTCVLILRQLIFTLSAPLHFFGIHKTFCLYRTCCTETFTRSIEIIFWYDWCRSLRSSTLKKHLYCEYCIELVQSRDRDAVILQLSSVYTR